MDELFNGLLVGDKGSAEFGLRLLFANLLLKVQAFGRYALCRLGTEFIFFVHRFLRTPFDVVAASLFEHFGNKLGQRDPN